MTNVTLCFSVNQALLAAKAGATFVSPFVGRLDDQGADGMQLIHDIRSLYDIYDFDTDILAASLRNPAHVAAAALAGGRLRHLAAADLQGHVQAPADRQGAGDVPGGLGEDGAVDPVKGAATHKPCQLFKS